MATADKGNRERAEALVRTAMDQGLPRPVAEQIVEETMAGNSAPDKLEGAVSEIAKIEKADRDLSTGKG